MATVRSRSRARAGRACRRPAATRRPRAPRGTPSGSRSSHWENVSTWTPTGSVRSARSARSEPSPGGPSSTYGSRPPGARCARSTYGVYSWFASTGSASKASDAARRSASNQSGSSRSAAMRSASARSAKRIGRSAGARRAGRAETGVVGLVDTSWSVPEACGIGVQTAGAGAMVMLLERATNI